MLVPGRRQRRLVDQVAQIGTDHPGSLRRDLVEVDVVRQRHTPGVDLEDRRASVAIRRIDRHPPIKPTRPQQRRIEDVRPVGRREHDHAGAGVKAVHLGQDLVERLLTLVVPAHHRSAAARPADRVELVDKDDRRGGLLGLLEQVTHAAGAHADHHLDELRRRHREERHPRLAGNGPSEQRLARAWKAGQQHPLRDRRAQSPVALRLAEELDDLGQLLLDLVDPGHVGERRALL